MILLPRQARDEHRENSRKSTVVFLQAVASKAPDPVTVAVGAMVRGDADDQTRRPDGVLQCKFCVLSFAKILSNLVLALNCVRQA